MTFNLSNYETTLFTMPLIMIAISSLLIIGILFNLLNNKTLRNKKSVFINTVVLLFIVYMLVTGVNQLSYGIDFFDKDNIEYELVTGEISALKEKRDLPRFYIDGETVKSKIIVIDEIEYFIMSIEGYRVGDIVEIEYLSKSKTITRIDFE